MQRKNEKFEKNVDELLKKLHDDFQSTMAPEQRKYKGVHMEYLIWNLFAGKYKFSFTMFQEVMKRLKEEAQ